MMKQFLTKAAILGSTLLLSATMMAAPALANTSSTFSPRDVGNNTGNPILLSTPFGFSNLSQAVNTLVTGVIFLGAIAAFVFIVIGAFRYVSAGEDAAGTKAARTIITNAVVGLILLALVFVIFQIVIRIIPGLSSSFTS